MHQYTYILKTYYLPKKNKVAATQLFNVDYVHYFLLVNNYLKPNNQQ